MANKQARDARSKCIALMEPPLHNEKVLIGQFSFGKSSRVINLAIVFIGQKRFFS